MKKIFVLLTAVLLALPALASHIVGGEMIYEYLGPGANGAKKYRITLRLFRDDNCTNCAGMPTNVYIGIFDNDTKRQVPAGTTLWHDVKREGLGDISTSALPPCIVNPPVLQYAVADYIIKEVELPENELGYTAAYQTCCRIQNMANVFNSRSASGTGSTYACVIPGTATVAADEPDSSPKFALAISVICHNKPFTLDFSAIDSDAGDVLEYSFCDAYNGGAAQGAANLNPAAPPYGPVPYTNNYTAAAPMGNKVTIDPKTGIISGIAPPEGEYVVCVCINVYRRGRLIATHRKDFIINVADCDFAGAELPPVIPLCDSLNVSFVNENTSPLNKTFFWDFGDGITSTEATPLHPYKDTGTYSVKLVVNRGQACSDSAITLAKVYPGFTPGFIVKGICVNKPSQFIDTSKSRYGTITSWAWDFGDATTLADTANVQNPVYTYKELGAKSVSLTVTNSKGCVRKVNNAQAITIVDKPPIALAFKDTLICNGDRLLLSASGDGAFSWTPSGNISNANTASPTVQPAATQKYFVQLDDNGCVNRDSVQVRVVDVVTLGASGDTTICLTDTASLRATGNGLRFSWSPASTLNNATSANPLAKPTGTTTYTVNAVIGPSCPVAAKNVTVTTIPYPVANAGADTTICFRTSAQLQGSMQASRFVWSPAQTLVGATTLNPVARPTGTTRYVLTVFDVLGCPKPGRDSVLVTVLPKINASAGNDTAVVVGQPLQLTATGGVRYLWQPSTNLSNPLLPNPVALYNTEEFDSIRYTVLVYNQQGCVDSAAIRVRIFKTVPSVFVPTAFSPNGDGRNDVLRPIAAGIAQIKFFRVFNRWGQLVFQTTQNGAGWNGRIAGKEQGSNVYVWMVDAVDYTGKKIFAKGTVTLIR